MIVWNHSYLIQGKRRFCTQLYCCSRPTPFVHSCSTLAFYVPFHYKWHRDGWSHYTDTSGPAGWQQRHNMVSWCWVTHIVSNSETKPKPGPTTSQSWVQYLTTRPPGHPYTVAVRNKLKVSGALNIHVSVWRWYDVIASTNRFVLFNQFILYWVAQVGRGGEPNRDDHAQTETISDLSEPNRPHPTPPPPSHHCPPPHIFWSCID